MSTIPTIKHSRSHHVNFSDQNNTPPLNILCAEMQMHIHMAWVETRTISNRRVDQWTRPKQQRVYKGSTYISLPCKANGEIGFVTRTMVNQVTKKEPYHDARPHSLNMYISYTYKVQIRCSTKEAMDLHKKLLISYNN